MNDTYHHGDLHAALIKKGMEMLSREGIENFSMRKLASALGVSHTAPYRHFKDKKEAIRAILTAGSEAFTEALRLPVMNETGEHAPTGMEALIQLGIRYVKFFVNNPEFFKFFLLINEEASLLEKIFPPQQENTGKELKAHCRGDELEDLPVDTSYGIFRSIAGEIFDQFPGLTEKEVLLGYWGKVHGLASLLITQPEYISGENRDTVIEKIIRTPF